MVKRSDSMVETVGETQRLQTTMHALQLDLLGFLNVGFAQDNQSICPFLETITMKEMKMFNVVFSFINLSYKTHRTYNSNDYYYYYMPTIQLIEKTHQNNSVRVIIFLKFSRFLVMFGCRGLVHETWNET